MGMQKRVDTNENIAVKANKSWNYTSQEGTIWFTRELAASDQFNYWNVPENVWHLNCWYLATLLESRKLEGKEPFAFSIS